jgi:phosphatidylglycerophosphatase A
VRPGLRFWHPAGLLATWFGIGLSPRAPGTCASLVALPFAWLIQRWSGAPGLLIAAMILFAVGCWTASTVSRDVGIKDPGLIVIDEVAGQWLTLVVAPLSVIFYVAGFVLFRIFDILKPWPVNWADRRLPGGFGIMGDDAIAALYAGVVLFVARYFLER